MDSSTSQSPIIVALDGDDDTAVRGWARDLAPVVGTLKVGLQATLALGVGLVADLAAEHPVFWDMKLHDIPNTVQGAAAVAQDLGVQMLTVHASGGPQMIAAAAKAAPDVAILAVTVLTSLDDAVLGEVGQHPADLQVPKLARLAVEAGAAGIVCSPHEVRAVRNAIGPEPLVVVPGIRPEGASTDDQARVATPRSALDAGASHLVIGRPITQADDPVAAARAIAATL